MMAGVGWQRVHLPDAVLEVDVRGTGEPIVLIQTALLADELVPLAHRFGSHEPYQIIVYHRRGYAGSSPVQGPGSIDRDAEDCRQLLAALDIDRAHLVGLSYSGAVVLQLAATTPGRVRSLTLIEPPPVLLPGADDVRAVLASFVAEYRLNGSAAALEYFQTRLFGPQWRADLERHLPGGLAQAERDCDTFFATDLPALAAWRFGQEDVRPITQPILYLGATESGQWFADVRELMLSWLPRAHDVVVAGADHSLALTHPDHIAAAIRTFLRGQPAGG